MWHGNLKRIQNTEVIGGHKLQFYMHNLLRFRTLEGEEMRNVDIFLLTKMQNKHVLPLKLYNACCHLQLTRHVISKCSININPMVNHDDGLKQTYKQNWFKINKGLRLYTLFYKKQISIIFKHLGKVFFKTDSFIVEALLSILVNFIL